MILEFLNWGFCFPGDSGLYSLTAKVNCDNYIFKTNKASLPSLFQLSMPDDVMDSKGEPTNVTFLTSIIFQIAPWVFTLAHTKCVELPSHQRGFCLQQMDTKIHNWSKCREKSTMGFPSPADMPTMHLSLGHPETEGRKAVRARRPWRMLWDNVFYLWPGNWTNKTSTMWLPKQGLPPSDMPTLMGEKYLTWP